MGTQRAVRHFTTQPVTEEDVTTILHAATRAPSGGNRQPWHFLVVRDRQSKRRLGQWYLKAWEAAVGDETRRTQPCRSGAELGNNLPDTPVVTVVCQQTGAAPTGASAFPVMQNLMLAAQGLGLGSVLTTLHTGYEPVWPGVVPGMTGC